MVNIYTSKRDSSFVYSLQIVSLALQFKRFVETPSPYLVLEPLITKTSPPLHVLAYSLTSAFRLQNILKRFRHGLKKYY